ncbi:MAG: hypothetical protein PHO14_07915 [Kiritimatiellae bacterium]|nr:hypothetical protein [Kiritimatiellia bacterium]MDD4342144.1 hypothetical protein [Kiritimatiellia bacterium]
MTAAALVLLGIAAGAWGAETVPLIVTHDWGPLWSWMDDADGNERCRAAGPFLERARGEDGMALQAMPRPLWARAADPATGRTAWDVLWPVAAGKTFHKETSARVLLAWYFNRDGTDPASQYSVRVIPLWFHGRDETGKGYAALFPLGGDIRNFLLKDRIRFVLWPLWTESWIKEVHTTDVLWPIWSRTTTPDGHLEKFRVFPFYMHSKNERLYDKHSVLWPVWTHARYVHPKAEGTAWVLFPLCGRVNLNSQKGWMVLPPLFQFIRGEQMSRTFCPWPFYQRETGLREKLAVWPLYGWRKDGALERWYWLWPLIVREKNHWATTHRNRWGVIPFYNNVTTSVETKPPTGEAGESDEPEASAPAPLPRRVVANRTKLWPLYSRGYDLEAKTYRLRLVDLWPAGHPPPVERSWAPLWTVLDYRAHGEQSDLDVLWGLARYTRREAGARAFSLFPLWRHDRAEAAGVRRWSVLKGLIAYDRTATTRQVRFLWLGRWRLAGPESAAEERRTPP